MSRHWRSLKRSGLSLAAAGALLLVAFYIYPDDTGAKVGATVAIGGLFVVAANLLLQPLKQRERSRRPIAFLMISGGCVGVASMWANAFWPAQVGAGVLWAGVVWMLWSLVAGRRQRRRVRP